MKFATLLYIGSLAWLSADETPWFQRSIVGMEVGPTGAQFGQSDPQDTRYCAWWDGREIVRQAHQAHSEYLVLWVRDGDYAYYNSKVLPKAPGLGTRDPLREAMEEARAQMMSLIAYCVVQQGGHFLKAHPEWEMRGATGQPLGRFCLNSGYLEAMKQLAAEQLAYGIDGFHIDMLDQGFGPPYGCWCDTCRAEFEKEFQHPMPSGATWDQAWNEMLQFRYRSSERFEKSLAAHVKSINPRATVDFNYHGNPPFSFEVGQRPVQHAGNADFVTGETGVWGFSALGVGLNAEFYRSSTPGHPYQVAMQRGVRMYHDQTLRPLADLRWELFTLLAHGAFVTMVDKTGLEGKLDPVAYERIGWVFQEALAKRAHFQQSPVQEVGIYYSSRSRDWLGREQPMAWMQSFLGAQKSLVYEHIPYGVLLDENVSEEGLRAFPVVILPNVGIISASEQMLLRHYVEAGGKLMVTGQSGQFDDLGKLLPESTLSELIGARVAGSLSSKDQWMSFAKEDERAGLLPSDLRSDWPFLVEGPATIYHPTTASLVGKLFKPQRTMRQQQGKEGTDWPMSADVSVGPAILLNQVGKGTVLTFAGSPDFATAGEHHTVEARRLLSQAVRFLNASPRVSIQAPANVETVVTDDPDSRTLRVHFMAYNSTPQTLPMKDRPYVLPGLIEEAPIFRATIQTREPLTNVQALNRTTAIRQQERRVEVMIEDIHEVLLLNY